VSCRATRSGSRNHHEEPAESAAGVHQESGRNRTHARRRPPCRRRARDDRAVRAARHQHRELDRICHDFIVERAAGGPGAVNYHGFPKSICTSVNKVICHGIPSDKRILKHGDIVNIDITVIKDGYYGDTSVMFLVGTPRSDAERLVESRRNACTARSTWCARVHISATSAT
jgi:methionine aminopeptidase